jgi:hypothetical protein
MQLSYILTLKDYKASLRLHLRQKLSRYISFIFWYRAVPVLAIAGLLAILILNITGRTELEADFIGVDAGLLWIAIVLPLIRVYQVRKSFKHMFPPGRTDRTCYIDIDDERIFTSLPGVGEGKYFWTGVIAFVQDEKVSMIYITEVQYLPIPTYTLSPEQLTELNDLVARHVVKRKP